MTRRLRAYLITCAIFGFIAGCLWSCGPKVPAGILPPSHIQELDKASDGGAAAAVSWTTLHTMSLWAFAAALGLLVASAFLTMLRNTAVQLFVLAVGMALVPFAAQRLGDAAYKPMKVGLWCALVLAILWAIWRVYLAFLAHRTQNEDLKVRLRSLNPLPRIARRKARKCLESQSQSSSPSLPSTSSNPEPASPSPNGSQPK